MAESINWGQDYDSAAEMARTTGKPMLVEFSAAPM